MSIKIGVILGSTRPQRAGEQVGTWFMEQTKNIPDASFEYIDLRDINLPFFDESIPPLMHQYQHDHTKAWAEKIAALDGFVVITPEYNHSFPAVLKNAFDFLSAEWNRKPISFVSYGASSGGSRAVEQLRQVAIELQMAPIREQVMIPAIWAAFDNGTVKKEHLLGDPVGMITDLLWWARVLKPAREALQQKSE